MPKLRKMLGDASSPECAAMMALIETQSGATLGAWAVDYARTRYLPLCQSACPGLREALAACDACLRGETARSALKPALRAAAQTAREAGEDPVVQAAARAVAAACAVLQTPTNALGFLFYGSAAVAYAQAGPAAEREVYDGLAAEEFRRAHASLEGAAVPDEPHPVRVRWNC